MKKLKPTFLMLHDFILKIATVLYIFILMILVT